MKLFENIFGKKNKEKISDSKETVKILLEKQKADATKKGKPWVSVIDMHVDPGNMKNGFFELDWNNEFIECLIDAGYKGESSEEIVDHWFKAIIKEITEEDDYGNRNAGSLSLDFLNS